VKTNRQYNLYGGVVFGTVLCVALALLAGCTQPRDPAIRFGLSAAPVTLDPRFATDAISQRINRLLYRRLVDFDEHYRMTPALADWQQLAPLHYRFTLRAQGRTFHNGGRLTAGDVKATYDYVLDGANGSPHRATLTNIQAIETIDDDTIDFHLYQADPLFPGKLVIGIMPAGLIAAGHPFNHDPVGSGPLKFVAWPGEDQLILERTADRQLIKFITVPDSTVRVLKLLRGEIDLVQGELPFELIKWLQKKNAIRVEKGRGDTFTYLGFNMRDPALKQLNVRKAIAYAIDRDAIINYVLGGAARRAGGLLTPDHWAGNPDLEGYAYDPDRARALLKTAGYDQGHPLQITYKTSNNPLRVRIATVLQYQLGQVGIKVDLRSYDWGTFYGDIKSGNFQMYSLSWVGLKMTDVFRYILHSTSLPPAGANRGYYRDANVDALIERAEARTDLEEQAQIYRTLQAYLQDQLPYVPLWYEDNVLARRANITGYTLSPDGNYDGLMMVTGD
jgi:peptide/nickel transport system substrate-binding protein